MNATIVSAARSKASLSGELSDFLIELSAALQKYAMYPPGHPVLGPASESVFKRLSVLLASHGSLSIGVAREQLIIEGVATDSSHALLRSLADRLHHHELGAISFAEGVAAVEIAEVLALVSEEPERTGRPLGREPEEVLKGRPHVRLHPVRYESLKLRATSEGTGHGGGPESGTHLWVGLAQAALASRDEECRSRNDYDPGEVARAIDSHSGDSGYDQVVIGYMVQIADDLKDADPLEENALRERFSELLGHLKPETLQRLLRMGGDTRQRKQFLDNASRGVAVDAVLELVKAAAEERQSDISRWMMQLLGKMARHARTEAREVRYRADESLRDQVRVLLSGWQLENPNPTEYEQTLGKISAGTPVTRMGGILARAPESGRIFRMSLETGTEGEALRCAVDELLDAGEFDSLVKSLAQAPPGTDSTNAAVDLTWQRLSEPAVVRRILSMDDPDPDAVEAVLERAGVSAAEALLDQLATAESLSLRRRTFDRIVQLGPTILPMAIQRIEQPESVPWYVLRNMLALVNAFESVPAGFTPATMHQHDNSQVRYEALKASLHIPEERDSAILKAIHDPEVRIVSLGTSASESGAPTSAETRLTEIALAPDCEPEIRIPAIRALGGFGTTTARDALLRFASPRRRLVGRSSIEGSAATCAALRALRDAWWDDPAAAPVLELAARSDDRAVREAVS